MARKSTVATQLERVLRRMRPGHVTLRFTSTDIAGSPDANSHGALAFGVREEMRARDVRTLGELESSAVLLG